MLQMIYTYIMVVVIITTMIIVMIIVGMNLVLHTHRPPKFQNPPAPWNN